MKHSNISIFIPHAGCPQQCSFCNQKTISGSKTAPKPSDVHRICRQALIEVNDRRNCEIAFFGGSFTAIDKTYMVSLLEAAFSYIGANGFLGIRVSTRPDFIDRDILDILKRYGVTAIELGAQSMDNNVLEANNRGHKAEDVFRASELIREYGFELGLQMMTGLYESSYCDEISTMNKIIQIKPDTVRIYPVVVLSGTRLAELYNSGEYKMMPFEEMTDLCANMLVEFEKNDIDVIKCGLHASDEVEGEKIAGYYHPAFREICESKIYRNKMEEEIIKLFKDDISNKRRVTFAVNPSCISKGLGHKKSNADYFRSTRGIDIKVIGDMHILKYHCEIRG